jgi:hypothetical protein
MARGAAESHHLFGVDEIFRAAKGDKGDFQNECLLLFRWGW